MTDEKIIDFVRKSFPDKVAKQMVNTQPIDLGKTHKTNLFKFCVVYRRMIRKFKNNHPIRYFFWNLYKTFIK